MFTFFYSVQLLAKAAVPLFKKSYVFVCVYMCVLSRDYHLVVVERLAWSCDPKSDTIWSYTPDRVTHGGKVKGGRFSDKEQSNQVLNGGTGRRIMAGLTGASQRLLMRMKAAEGRGPRASWNPCHWILTPFCQGSYGDYLCTSLPTLNKITPKTFGKQP